MILPLLTSLSVIFVLIWVLFLRITYHHQPRFQPVRVRKRPGTIGTILVNKATVDKAHKAQSTMATSLNIKCFIQHVKSINESKKFPTKYFSCSLQTAPNQYAVCYSTEYHKQAF